MPARLVPSRHRAIGAGGAPAGPASCAIASRKRFLGDFELECERVGPKHTGSTPRPSTFSKSPWLLLWRRHFGGDANGCAASLISMATSRSRPQGGLGYEHNRPPVAPPCAQPQGTGAAFELHRVSSKLWLCDIQGTAVLCMLTMKWRTP